jgi:hypothetical protein
MRDRPITSLGDAPSKHDAETIELVGIVIEGEDGRRRARRARRAHPAHVRVRRSRRRRDRTVALKVLPEDFSEDGHRQRRFLREARLAAALVHPNVATIHEVGEAEGRIYIVMELVTGTTLRRRLEGGPLPVEEAVRIAKDIARGVAKAHARGIAHRDLKPDNVMVSDDGTVKVLDFGLAKPVEREPQSGDDPENVTVTQEGRIIGTPGYLPRAGDGPRRRCADRRVLARRRALRDAHRDASVQGRDVDGGSSRRPSTASAASEGFRVIATRARRPRPSPPPFLVAGGLWCAPRRPPLVLESRRLVSAAAPRPSRRRRRRSPSRP